MQTGTSSFSGGILQEMRVSISSSGDMNHNGTVSKGEFQRIYTKKRKELCILPIYSSYLFFFTKVNLAKNEEKEEESNNQNLMFESPTASAEQ